VNRKQRDNLARYAYDVSKIMVAVPVLGNALSAGFSILAFWLGMAAALVFLVLGLFLDRKSEGAHEQS
jgi:ABC-type proline/glycine betaine transport system permease subunit